MWEKLLSIFKVSELLTIIGLDISKSKIEAIKQKYNLKTIEIKGSKFIHDCNEEYLLT